MAFRIRQKYNRQGISKPTKLNTAKLPSAIERVLSRRWTVLSPNGRRRKAQHQTRNDQLCSRSYTTQLRHILANQTENTRTGSRPQRPRATDSYELKRSNQPESVAKQGHYIHHHNLQRCLQTATKRHPCTEVDWWERKAVELQRAAERNEMKGFYNGLKEVWGPKKKGHVHLKSTDEMETFSESKRVVARWSEHIPEATQRPWRHRSRSSGQHPVAHYQDKLR